MLFVAIGLLSGCANGYHPLTGLGLNVHDQELSNFYNNSSATLESQAEAGQITWVEAATKIRYMDWKLANSAGQFDTSWKFDSNDEEFHQYSIALAERVDKRQISVPQYKSMKLQKLNQVQQRQQILRNQTEQTRLLRENQRILQNQPSKSFRCETFGSTTTCN